MWALQNKDKKPSQSNYSSIENTCANRIWTQVADFISFDNNRYGEQ